MRPKIQNLKSKILVLFCVLCAFAVQPSVCLAAAYNFRATTPVNAGDVVIWDISTAYGIKTTTTEGADIVAGVAAETVSAGNDCTIRQDGGRVTVNVTGAVTKGQWLIASSVAGKAKGVNTTQSGIFAIAITDSGTPAPGQCYASVNLGFLGYASYVGGPHTHSEADITDYAQMLTVAKSGAEYSTIQSAIDAITDASASKRYLVRVMPGLYSEQVTMKAWVDLCGSGRHSAQIQFTGNNNGTVILASGAQIADLCIQETDAASEWAIVGSNISNVSVRNIDILGSGSNVSQGIKLTGNTWSNVYIDNCRIDYLGTTGYGIYLAGNSAAPQNCASHFTQLSLDSFNATTGGSLYVKNVTGLSLRTSLLRTASVGFNVKLEDTSAATTTMYIENCTLEYGTSSLEIGTGCTVYEKQSSVTTVANSGTYNRVFGTIDAKGDLLAGTADNRLARLAAGNDGEIPTADSTQPTGLRWANRGDIANHVNFFTHFLGTTLPDEITAATGGTGASAAFADSISGGYRLSVGTASGSTAKLYLGSDTIRNFSGTKNAVCEIKMNIASLVNKISYQIGFYRTPVTVGTTDRAIFFARSDVNSGNWVLYSSNEIPTETTNTTTAATGSQTLRIEVSASSVKFYSNGTLVATHSTQVPNDPMGITVYVVQEANPGTAGNVDIDGIWVGQAD